MLTVWFMVPIAGAQEPSLYVVGPKDVLAVSVYNQPQLTGKYVVDAEGMFTFPLIGRVQASGITLQALEEQLRTRLARGYLKDPQVTVAVDEYGSQQVFVMGEVREPGGMPLAGGMTLLEALARAGSTTDRAGVEAVIVRPPKGLAPANASAGPGPAPPESEVFRVNLQSLQTGSLSQNVALQAGDTVFVPRAQTVFVSGRVKSPGEYVMRKGMTVRQALALAGGETDRGSTRRIQILRQVDGTEVKIDASLQDQVQPGDTIVVRERFF